MRPVPAAIATAVLPALLACTPAPSPVTQATSSATEPTTVSEVSQEVLATVEGVDLSSRILTLRRPDGSVEKIYAPADVENLPQVQLGDQVVVTYAASITAARLADDTVAGSVRDEGVMAAPKGGKPGIASGGSLTTVVTVDSYDPATHLVTFTDSDGIQRSAEVERAEMQALASSLKPGDKVGVIFSEAAALTIRRPKS